ncbi:hypothetical protein FIA58_013180 [Flavobacterium jejuense]|uniref:Uncharacterized protein n=1 Tax=Flavobacterium jejuense TaxID=1544455 RepID=A0ABX0IRX8_9FLAO|nr:hypothetical protein [Flavobacterium jejuense]NHN26632.1 hypothetical protein [Flavobacterium jejuense]
MKYKLLISREGVNQVKIFKHQTNGLYTNEWNFSLKGDDEPIVFSEFYNENQFVVINWNGWIRLFDAEKKELVLDYNLNGNIGAEAVFSIDKSKIYIVLKDKEHKTFLATLCLATHKIQLQELGNYFSFYLQIRNDGCLLFYKQNWRFENNKKVYSHGFTVYNPVTKERNYYSLPHVPHSSFDVVKPFIDAQKNIGIMPYYGEVTVKKKDNENALFEYKIMLFDLNTFEIELLVVRDFELNQLGCSDCNELAEQFLNLNEGKEYQEAISKFCYNLNSIKFVEDGFWLCWRGGILRKVYDDKTLSPLLVTSEVSNTNMGGMFEFIFFHTYLSKITDKKIFLSEHRNYYVFDLPEITNQKSEMLIPIQLKKMDLEEIEKLSYSKEKSKEIANLSKIIIEVNDLSEEEDLINVLQQIENKISNIEELGIGTKLVFHIEDKKGNILNEKDFFEKVIALKNVPKIVQAIIENFCQYSKAKYIYRNEEETALCHAVLELAKQGESYLHTILRYLDTIDLDHDVFNRENLVPYLEEQYTRDFLMKKIQSVSEDLLEWYEYYSEFE